MKWFKSFFFFLVTCHWKFHVFRKKAILVGHVINQGRKRYNGRPACLTKENNLSLLQSAMEFLQIATA